MTGYWYVFLDGDSARAKGPAYVANSDDLTRAVNHALAEAAAAKGARYADLYGPFKGDGFRDDTLLLAHAWAEGRPARARRGWWGDAWVTDATSTL